MNTTNNDKLSSVSASQPVTEVTTGNKKSISVSIESLCILHGLLMDERERVTYQIFGAAVNLEGADTYRAALLKRLNAVESAVSDLLRMQQGDVSEGASPGVEAEPMGSQAHGAMLVTDVRLAHNGSGLCLVAVRSPLVGWFNVIQELVDPQAADGEFSRSVNLADAHGAV